LVDYAGAMTDSIRVTIEHTPKKTFASAVDWAGWTRSGRTEELALGTLAAYGPRYAPVALSVRRRFAAAVTADDLIVVERNAGGAGTEFGVPSVVTAGDSIPMNPEEAGQTADLVAAAWARFDHVAAAAPEELRKGPRGGGRNTSKVIGHVMEADRAYADVMGIKIKAFGAGDDLAIRSMRDAMLEILRAARSGEPLAGRRWPPRYAARRIAWHALDHAWEIEDRTESRATTAAGTSP
jgi:hypothetical protein